MRPLLAIVDGHEVDQLAHAVFRQEPGDEHVRVGHVQLLRRPPAAVRRNPEEAAALRVEDRSEHAGGVEAARAVPVDRALGTNERRRVQVADDAVLRDRQVVVTRRRIAPANFRIRNAVRMAAVVQAERLTKNYGSRPAVVDLDFSVEQGEVFGYLGPNGAGKPPPSD